MIETLVKFYLSFNNFNSIIKNHILINLCQEKFLEDLRRNNLTSYRTADQKSLEEIDAYADDYQEIEEMELLLLVGFSNSIHEDRKKALFYLFDGIINILDYQEQFSERPKYWNNLLEKELSNQLDLLSSKSIELNYYTEKYNLITFEAF